MSLFWCAHCGAYVDHDPWELHCQVRDDVAAARGPRLGQRVANLMWAARPFWQAVVAAQARATRAGVVPGRQ